MRTADYDPRQYFKGDFGVADADFVPQAIQTNAL